MEVHKFNRKVVDEMTSIGIGFDTSKNQIQLYFPGRGVAGFTEGEFDFYDNSDDIVVDAERLVSGFRHMLPSSKLAGSVYGGLIDLSSDIVESFIYRHKIKILSDVEFNRAKKSIVDLLG